MPKLSKSVCSKPDVTWPPESVVKADDVGSRVSLSQISMESLGPTIPDGSRKLKVAMGRALAGWGKTVSSRPALRVLSRKRQKWPN